MQVLSLSKSPQLKPTTHPDPRSAQQAFRDPPETAVASSPSHPSSRQLHSLIYPPVPRTSRGWLGCRVGVFAWMYQLCRGGLLEGYLRECWRFEKYLGHLCARDVPIVLLKL